MVRKSSRGNPNHDEKGRFCSAENCKKKVDYKSERDYMVQTAQRKRAENPPPKVDAYVVGDDSVTTVYGDTLQKGMIVEYDPAWAEPGHEEEEAKYLLVVKDMNVNEKGKGWADITAINGRSTFATIQRVDAESIRPASVEKVKAIDKAMTPEERQAMARKSGWHRTVKYEATDMANKLYADSFEMKGANFVEFDCGGEKIRGYVHVENEVGYFKPVNGDRYVTVDRYISTREYESRYDYIIDRHDTNDFTEIVGSIGGDVERVRIYNDGRVGAK